MLLPVLIPDWVRRRVTVGPVGDWDWRGCWCGVGVGVGVDCRHCWFVDPGKELKISTGRHWQVHSKVGWTRLIWEGAGVAKAETQQKPGSHEGPQTAGFVAVWNPVARPEQCPSTETCQHPASSILRDCLACLGPNPTIAHAIPERESQADKRRGSTARAPLSSANYPSYPTPRKTRCDAWSCEKRGTRGSSH